MKICVLTTATNRYLRFVEPLRASSGDSGDPIRRWIETVLPVWPA
jgi:hypothetical protein